MPSSVLLRVWGALGYYHTLKRAPADSLIKSVYLLKCFQAAICQGPGSFDKSCMHFMSIFLYDCIMIL